MSILSNLSKDKLNVIKNIEGPCLVRAGAGTGKTRTIVAKIAYLIKEKGFDESRILGLTFSTNAADQLKEKIDKSLGYCSKVEVSTFHSYCKSILDKYGEKIGVSDFKLIDKIDSAILLHKLGYPVRKCKIFISTISKAKDLNISLKDYKRYLQTLYNKLKDIVNNESSWESYYNDIIVQLRTIHNKDLNRSEKSNLKRKLLLFKDNYELFKKYEELINAWEEYEKEKNKQNFLDLSDLNLKVLELVKVVDKDFLSKNYDYIIIDEFQDTNYIQFELIKHLVNDKQNITVVGDPNQTIYAFRGAYTNNVDGFIKEFNLKKNNQYTLTTNFRSTQNILDASHKLILENNPNTIRLISDGRIKGNKVRIFSCLNELEEARKVKEIIEEQIKKGVALNEIAVLYRSHNQGKIIKQILENRGFPINVRGETDLLSFAEIKAVISLLELINNLENPNYMGDQSWWRILHYENQLSPEDSILLANFKKKTYLSIQEILFNHLNELNLSKEGKFIIRNIKNQLNNIRKYKNNLLTKLVMKSYEILGINKFNPESRKNRLLLMKEFYELAKNFQENYSNNLSDFLSYLELFNEIEQEHLSEASETNAINLMTIHASKGLEFDTVILINLANQKFPLIRGGKEPLLPDELNPQVKDLFNNNLNKKDLELAIKERKKELKLKEERKLCYVAMTRAKKELYLTRAKEYNGNEREPSIFLSDLGVVSYGDYKNIIYTEDNDTKADLNIDTELERQKKTTLKKLIKSLEKDDIKTSIFYLLTYKGLLNQFITKNELIKEWDKINITDEIKRLKEKIKTGIINTLPFDAENFKLSASGLKNYNKCPRLFELSNIYLMPTYWDEDSSGALNKGSFVHKVCELAVKEKIKKKEDLFKIKDSLLKKQKWKGINTKGIDIMLNVFWERNKDKINKNLYTEERFDIRFRGFRFTGIIDRIDKTKNGIEIIDYKTGKSNVSYIDTIIQLGLYAIAIKNSPKFNNLNPVRLTLEMLEHDAPKTYKIENNVIKLLNRRGKSTTLKEVEDLILSLAKNIMYDYQHGFKKNEKECDMCPYKFYCKD